LIFLASSSNLLAKFTVEPNRAWLSWL